jgi:hypothetical protein
MENGYGKKPCRSPWQYKLRKRDGSGQDIDLAKPPSDITKATLEWNAQETRKRGRSRTTW